MGLSTSAHTHKEEVSAAAYNSLTKGGALWDILPSTLMFWLAWFCIGLYRRNQSCSDFICPVTIHYTKDSISRPSSPQPPSFIFYILPSFSSTVLLEPWAGRMGFLRVMLFRAEYSVTYSQFFDSYECVYLFLPKGTSEQGWEKCCSMDRNISI